MKRLARLALGGIAALALLALWNPQSRLGPTAQQPVEILDPARIQLIRTPGGYLQVGEMAKVEEFGWQTSWTCPFIDCSRLPKTISRIRVKAHYVYRIPLAGQWRLEPEGSHYRLRVPALQVQAPVAFDTTRIEIVTTEKSVMSPAAGPNRDKALRHLGPELARRGASAAYLDAQQRAAEQTVREFAQKWLVEQGGKVERPIEVVFDAPAPL